MSFFAALYLYLVLGKPLPYFEVMTVAFKCMFFTLILPYVGLGMALRIYDYHESAAHPEDHSIQRMRFYDSMRNLKIVLMPQSVLYIAAEENYVNIYYTENERVKEYVLRSSMKAIDEVCQDNGLIRCHRSYYINPAHVKVLRKDKDGVMYAELNADNLRNIPVSKTYYSRLSEML
jgi:DNA-binding LytR/AlgR family response regulator